MGGNNRMALTILHYTQYYNYRNSDKKQLWGEWPKNEAIGRKSSTKAPRAASNCQTLANYPRNIQLLLCKRTGPNMRNERRRSIATILFEPI